MIKKDLQPGELHLYNGIDTILRNEWPPVIAMSPDEYQRCHNEVFHLVLGDISPSALAQYLHDIAIETAGWQSYAADHLPIAETIRKLKSVERQ